MVRARSPRVFHDGLAAGATWSSLCIAAVVLDALAVGRVTLAQAVFLACACAPMIIERVAAARATESAARTLSSLAWLFAAAVLLLTSDGGGLAFVAWLALPAAWSLLRGRPRGAVVEALALSAAAGFVLAVFGDGGGARPAWSYGALPAASAVGVAALAGLAAARAAHGRRWALARARVAAGRAASIVDASPDVFLWIDHQDRVLAHEGGADGEVTSHAAGHVGENAGGLFAKADRARFEAALARVRRVGEPERLVLAGEAGLVEARLVRTALGEVLLALRPASPEVAALSAAVRAREEAEEAVRARSSFFAGMGHELRTPLNAVLGFSDTMRAKVFGPLPAKYAEYAEDIHASAKLLLDLVGDLLDVSKIEAGRYELETARFDAREAAQAVARMMRPAAEAGEVRLEIEAPDAAIEVDADLRALKQMLLNLASNAVKFTEPGGVVRLVMAAKDGSLVAEVADTGPGLTPDEIERIARPFEQTEVGLKHEARGSGLGLALVRALAELHGGRMEIESRPGEGSTFRLRLPVLVPAEPGEESMDARGRLQRVRAAGFAGAEDDDAAEEA